jgi:DNA-binding beta-propeller fold protein YncE
VVTDSAGNVYVADFNNETIRKITPDGSVSTLAGTAGAAGSSDGTGAAARFFSPTGVATDSAGNVLCGG